MRLQGLCPSLYDDGISLLLVSAMALTALLLRFVAGSQLVSLVIAGSCERPWRLLSGFAGGVGRLERGQGHANQAMKWYEATELTLLLDSSALSPVLSCIFVLFFVLGRTVPFSCGPSVRLNSK